MAFADTSTYFRTGDSSILGRFDEKENGHLFEYSENRETEGWGAEHKADLPHKIWVSTPHFSDNGHCLDSGFRYGRVLKTVAYVAVDEDSFGNPVFEKWYFKQRSHFEYDRSRVAEFEVSPFSLN